MTKTNNGDTPEYKASYWSRQYSKLEVQLVAERLKRESAEERASQWAEVAGNLGKEKNDALARVEELESSLQFIATVRSEYPKEHSRHLLLKLCEREAREVLTLSSTGAANRRGDK